MAIKTFQEGEDIKASETNSNNQELLSKINDNASQLDSYVKAQINAMQSNINTVQSTLQSNINNVKSSVPSSATISNYAMPKYSSSSSIASGSTISKNGWLRIKLKCDYGNDVYVRADSTTGTILAGIDWTRKQDYSGTYFWYFVPVAKSTKIYFTGTTDYVMQCTFFPCIGG